MERSLIVFSIDDVRDCASCMRPALPGLLGADAAVVEAEFDRLLTQEETEEQIDAFLDIFAQREPTKVWARHFLESSRRYDPLPGAPSPLGSLGTSYYCLRCGTRWTLRQVGTTPPSACYECDGKLRPVVSAPKGKEPA